MNNEKLFERLTYRIPNELILRNEPMKKHTSFRIGGPTDLMLIASDVQHIRAAIFECRSMGIPYYVIGNGSNLLVGDKGFRGLIIKISDCFNKISIDDNKVWAQAGALIATVSKTSIEAALSGLEFATGIPGTIGGAIAMNAGAYTAEMKDVVRSVLVLNKDGEEFELTNEALGFSYRNSRIQERDLIMLEAYMELTHGDRKAISELAEEYTMLRRLKQPLSFPSAGSVFKRPPGYYAGKLIDEAGLRGFKVGDAQVSDLHCGFIINLGNATANDVIALIEIVKNKVKKKAGIDLQLEIKIIGETD
jgi:UDP-N-acetylmuramate dehydrogenase